MRRKAYLCRVTLVPILHPFPRYCLHSYTHTTSLHVSIASTLLIDWLYSGARQKRLNRQQAGFGRAAQEHEQAARDEVHVAFAWAIEMSRAEMREIMGVLENKAEQCWTSHLVMLLFEMKSVAGDTSEKHRRSLLSEAMAELQRHRRTNHEHL